MTPYLLDLNILIAMADPTHIHHSAAHRWFSDRGAPSWATCPLTENGFVRVISNPKYPNSPGDGSSVLRMLRRFCDQPGHQFWPDDVSLRSSIAPDLLITHAQVTDLYLVALAVQHRGRLATFDRRIAASLVAGGVEAVETVPA